MDNNTTIIAIVAIIAIVVIAAMVLMQPHATPTTLGGQQGPAQGTSAPAGSGASTTPGGSSGQQGQGSEAGMSGTPGGTGAQEGTGASGEEVGATGKAGETTGETEVEEVPLEEEGLTEDEDENDTEAGNVAMECSFSVQGAAGGSASGDAKLEGSNMAGEGTVAIPGFSTGMQFIVNGDLVYLNFPTINTISDIWYKVTVEELSEVLLATEYADTEELTAEELEQIDIAVILTELGEITVSSEDLSDIEAILEYMGAAGGMTQEEIDAMLALVPTGMSMSCSFVSDIPDGEFELPSGAEIKEGLPLIVKLYLGL